MPVDVKVTCDVCGAEGERYPSFFQITNANAGRFQGAGITNLVKPVDPEMVIDTRGCLRYSLGVCLCRDHFSDLEETLVAWLAGQLLNIKGATA